MHRISPPLAMLVAVAALAPACSRDLLRADAEDAPAGQVAVATPAASAGVGVLSAHELGPQARAVPVSSSSPAAAQAFERGRELHENMRTAEAALEFRRALELDPAFALAHAYLGLVTKSDEREQHVRRARELSASLSRAERLAIAAVAARASEDMAELAEVATELARIAPRDWRAMMWIGDAADRRGDLEAAITGYQRSISINPRVAEPYNQLAYVFAYRGEYDKALDAARSYARLKPDEPNPHDSLGEILLLAGNFAEAERAFRRALEVAPGFGIAWEGVAASLAYRGRWADAAAALERAVAIGQGSKARLELAPAIAIAYVGAGKLKKAMASLDGLLGAGDEPALRSRAALGRGLALVAGGKLERAHAAFAAAAEQDGDARPYALVWRTWVELQLGKTDAAARTVEALEATLEADPKLNAKSAVAIGRGMLALANGDAERAVEHLADIGEDFPFAALARVELAAALEAAGAADEARKVRGELARWNKRDVAHALLRGKLAQLIGGAG